MYEKYLRADIDVKILSNYGFYSADIEKDFKKFKKRLKDYDVGVYVKDRWKTNGKLNGEGIKIFNSLGEELSWADIVLNYMKALNTFMREQIGVCIDKNIPRIIDNELTYLIIQRKDKKDFSDMFFIAIDGEVVFPMITRDFDVNLALFKLAEWKNRADMKNLIKFHN
jgi:exoribonuclease R